MSRWSFSTPKQTQNTELSNRNLKPKIPDPEKGLHSTPDLLHETLNLKQHSLRKKIGPGLRLLSMGRRFVGTVRSWNADGGFGFIAPQILITSHPVSFQHPCAPELGSQASCSVDGSRFSWCLGKEGFMGVVKR